MAGIQLKKPHKPKNKTGGLDSHKHKVKERGEFGISAEFLLRIPSVQMKPAVTCVVWHGRLISVPFLLEDNVAKLKDSRDDPQQAFGV